MNFNKSTYFSALLVALTCVSGTIYAGNAFNCTASNLYVFANTSFTDTYSCQNISGADLHGVTYTITPSDKGYTASGAPDYTNNQSHDVTITGTAPDSNPSATLNINIPGFPPEPSAIDNITEVAKPTPTLDAPESVIAGTGSVPFTITFNSSTFPIKVSDITATLTQGITTTIDKTSCSLQNTCTVTGEFTPPSKATGQPLTLSVDYTLQLDNGPKVKGETVKKTIKVNPSSTATTSVIKIDNVQINDKIAQGRNYTVSATFTNKLTTAPLLNLTAATLSSDPSGFITTTSDGCKGKALQPNGKSGDSCTITGTLIASGNLGDTFTIGANLSNNSGIIGESTSPQQTIGASDIQHGKITTNAVSGSYDPAQDVTIPLFVSNNPDLKGKSLILYGYTKGSEYITTPEFKLPVTLTQDPTNIKLHATSPYVIPGTTKNPTNANFHFATLAYTSKDNSIKGSFQLFGNLTATDARVTWDKPTLSSDNKTVTFTLTNRNSSDNSDELNIEKKVTANGNACYIQEVTPSVSGDAYKINSLSDKYTFIMKAGENVTIKVDCNNPIPTDSEVDLNGSVTNYPVWGSQFTLSYPAKPGAFG
jgi:hypothetical protein